MIDTRDGATMGELLICTKTVMMMVYQILYVLTSMDVLVLSRALKIAYPNGRMKTAKPKEHQVLLVDATGVGAITEDLSSPCWIVMETEFQTQFVQILKVDLESYKVLKDAVQYGLKRHVTRRKAMFALDLKVGVTTMGRNSCSRTVTGTGYQTLSAQITKEIWELERVLKNAQIIGLMTFAFLLYNLSISEVPHLYCNDSRDFIIFLFFVYHLTALTYTRVFN